MFQRSAGLIACAVVALLSGCASTIQRGDFVRPFDIASQRTFEVREALTTGFNWHDSEALVVQDLSSEILVDGFSQKGFVLVGEGERPDFFVVPKWRKHAGHRVNRFSPVDPAQGSTARNRPAGGFGVRYTLILEVFEEGTDEMFWRVELRDVFEATRFSHHRVILSLERAVRDFPSAQ